MTNFSDFGGTAQIYKYTIILCVMHTHTNIKIVRIEQEGECLTLLTDKFLHSGIIYLFS